MLLLNISDIHFQHPICNGPMDPDRPYRTLLIQDAAARVAPNEHVGAILVGGDIAFGGAAEEYRAAILWLRELAEACRCPLERVFVVPGNHDMDRGVIQNNISCRNALRAVARAARDARGRELFQQFINPETGRALLAPLATYNDFAARFSCQVYAPDRLFWHQDLPLDEKTVLRVYGLTSPFLSWSNQREDEPRDLYLSPLQTVLDPIAGHVNLVVCHHPPEWLTDGEDVEDAVRARAAIQFFGHKHRQRITRDAEFVRFSSGAVNPDRYENGWEPGYNLVRLSTTEDGGERFLDIEAHLLVWQTGPDRFRPKASESGDTFKHRLRIRGCLSSMRVIAELEVTATANQSATVTEVLAVAEQDTVESAMGEDHTRNLVLRFWNLASSDRRAIALVLDLLEADEFRLPEAERYGRALKKAGERGLLDRLAKEIQTRERH